MAFADPAQKLLAAKQLQRLRELRERKALKAHQDAEAAVNVARQRVVEREAEIKELQRRRLALQQSLVGPYAARLGAVALYAGAAQEALDDQLERAEYALIDEEEELFDARKRSHVARDAWLHAVSQHQASTTMRDDARVALRREQEARADREDPPVRAQP
jgi:hypothetical protein